MTSHMLTSTNPRRKAILVRPCTMLMVLMVPMETSVTLAKKMTSPRRRVARSNPCSMSVAPRKRFFLAILINRPRSVVKNLCCDGVRLNGPYPGF